MLRLLRLLRMLRMLRMLRIWQVFRAKHRQTGTWYAVKAARQSHRLGDGHEAEVFKTQQRPVAPEVVRECEASGWGFLTHFGTFRRFDMAPESARQVSRCRASGWDTRAADPPPMHRPPLHGQF